MITYKEIDRVEAKKRYKNNRSVFLLPDKTRTNNAWIKPYEINKFFCNGGDFDEVVYLYEYYNCNSECGKHAKFYVIALEEE